MKTNVNAYKAAQQRAQAPPVQNQGQSQKPGAAFDDLLSGFGTTFGAKEADKNRKMGDLKVCISGFINIICFYLLS
mgnify:CR=1 FL=1